MIMLQNPADDGLAIQNPLPRLQANGKIQDKVLGRRLVINLLVIAIIALCELQKALIHHLIEGVMDLLLAVIEQSGKLLTGGRLLDQLLKNTILKRVAQLLELRMILDKLEAFIHHPSFNIDLVNTISKSGIIVNNYLTIYSKHRVPLAI